MAFRDKRFQLGGGLRIFNRFPDRVLFGAPAGDQGGAENDRHE